MSDASDKLHVATTTADTSYHACRASRREIARGKFLRALCGIPCRPTPNEWDAARQQRQDSCHRCVHKVRSILNAEIVRRQGEGAFVAGYIRASTDKQVDSPDVQKSIILTHCERHKLPEPRWYIDNAVSGKLPLIEREAGRALIRDLRRGDTVFVARVDRLSRNFLDFCATLDTWVKQGITLIPCDFPMVIKPDDQLSLVFVQMLSLFASYERQMIATRTREALHWRIEQGRKHSDDAPFGFRWEWDRERQCYMKVIDEFEASICIKAVELVIAGFTYNQIADYLNDTWGVRNPRAERHASGKLRRCRITDPARRGRFVFQRVSNLIDRGLEIMQLKGMPLPDGVKVREDLMLK